MTALASYVPMSHLAVPLPSPSAGRKKPRWSVASSAPRLSAAAGITSVYSRAASQQCMRLGRPALVLQRTEKGIRREYVSGHGGDNTLPRWRYANQVIPLREEYPGTVADVIGITSDLIVSASDRVLKVTRGAQLTN